MTDWSDTLRNELVAVSAASLEPDAAPGRWRALALMGFAELLGMSLWFAGNAIAPQLQQRWALTPSEVGWLTTAVQFGFVAGTAIIAVLNLADVVASRTLFAVSAVLGAGVNAVLVWDAGFGVGLASRFACGFCLAGVYPPAMKMISTWFKARRGLAVGTVVGALTIGKATPYLVQAFPGVTANQVVLVGSAGAVLAAALVWFAFREGPYPFPPRPFSWSLVRTVASQRQWRLATGGYLGHMFELYSYWTWIPAFFAASALAYPLSSGGVFVLSFAVIAIGGLGCVWGGLVADRIGRERFVIIAMTASGACALFIGFAFGRTWWMLAPVALAWGFFVVADSAQFSVMVTESVPPHAAGTALMLQTSLGFLLTTVTIQLVPPMQNAFGWPWAFTILALGPWVGISAIRRLVALKRERVPDNIPAG